MKKNNDKVTSLLTNTLLDLIDKKDFENITISELCNKAGVGRMSFYRNFDSIEDILRKHVAEITDNFIKNSKIDHSSDQKNYIISLFEHLKNNKDISMKLYKINKLYIIKEIFDKTYLNSKNINLNSNEYKAYLISGGLFNAYYCWIKNNFKESPEEIANLILN